MVDELECEGGVSWNLSEKICVWIFSCIYNVIVFVK